MTPSFSKLNVIADSLSSANIHTVMAANVLDARQ